METKVRSLAKMKSVFTGANRTLQSALPMEYSNRSSLIETDLKS